MHRLKTMLVFGRVGPRVAMGNTCGGVSRRAALQGDGAEGWGLWGTCGVGGRERLLEKEGMANGRL